MSEVTGTASTASVAASAPAVIDPSAWGAVFSDGPGEATAKGAALDIGSIAKLKAKAGKAKGKVKAKGAAAPKYAAASRSSAASSVSNDREPYEENRPSLFGAPAGGSSAGGFGVGSGGGRKTSALDGAPPPLARKGVKGLSWNKPGAEMKRSYARPWEKNGPQIVYHSPHEHNAASYMQRWWKWKRQDLSGYQIKKLSRKHQNMMMRKIDNFETRNIASIQARARDQRRRRARPPPISHPRRARARLAPSPPAPARPRRRTRARRWSAGSRRSRTRCARTSPTGRSRRPRGT